MDDREQPPAQENAQDARDKGAALEYDAGDEDALAQPTAPPVRENSAPAEEKLK